MRKFLTFLAMFFSLGINVKAASLCNYQEQMELNQKAAAVSWSYEVVEETLEGNETTIINPFFRITILNVTEDLYVVIKNDVDNNSVRFEASDAKDGIITYDWKHDETITNFTLEVYSSNKTNCANEVYKTFYMTTPRYNDFYNREICHQYADFYLCQKYITTDEVSEDDFLQKVESYDNGKIDDEGKDIPEDKDDKLTDNIFKFIDDYKWVIVGVVVLAVGTATVILIRNRRKQRDLGL